MTADVWSDRAELYRQSAIHATGDDLDLVVEWCEPGEGVTVLDVATGGGHVARRLRAAGCSVVTVDPAPGMQADVLAPADHLPFADSSFDAVACRIAAHHFPDVLAAVKEMARVAKQRVVICDNTCATTAPPNGRASSSSRAFESPSSGTWSGRSRSSRGSPAPGHRPPTRRA